MVKANPRTVKSVFFRQVLESHIQPANRCFLFIDHEESSYGGVLTVDNHDFCAKLVRFLQTLNTIGSLLKLGA